MTKTASKGRNITGVTMAQRLSAFGAWQRQDRLSPEVAISLETLGYATIWIGGSPGGDLSVAQRLLAATSSIQVATGIVNIWRTSAPDVATAFHRIDQRHPGRFMLGIGVGHPEVVAGYIRPRSALMAYLDELDRLGVPSGRRVLAALGPKILRLAADRCAGAHPYLVTPDYTERARQILGPGALLVPDQKVVLDPGPARARALARGALRPYLGMVNYTNNLRTLGFGDADLAGDGSGRLVDALVAQGDPESVAARLQAHLAAGADQVAINLVSPDADPVAGYAALAAVLSGASPVG